MDAKYFILFCIKLLLFMALPWSLFAAQGNIVLVAEKNSPALNKLLIHLKKTNDDFSYQISTAKNSIVIPIDSYVIAIGAKPVTHVDLARYPNRIAVMLTAKQAENADMATSIFIEPPLSRQLKLANSLVPGNKKIGLLVSDEQDKKSVFMTLTDEEKMMLKVVNIAEYDNINQALFHVLKNTRLLLGHYNNEVYNAQNIKNILITSYRQRKVLIGPSRAYLKAGSFSTTFSDLSHIALRVIEVVEHHKDTGQWLKADYNPHYRILFNSQVARSLSIRMLDEKFLLQKMGKI
jgi:putative ABC transport system substrate-binding protein